jgi:enoyl-CoA hydratase
VNPYADLVVSSDGDVLTVVLNRPKVLNSFRSNTLKELECILDESAQNSKVRAMIITGAGDIAFSAGGDIKEMESMGENEARAFAELSHRVLNKIENLEKPVIAAVNGFAFGAGCDLASICDICVASDKAQFGMPSTRLGIITPFGGTQRLPRIVGPKFAKYMLLTGEPIDARTALEVGIATKVVPHDSVLFESKRIALKILDQAPFAIRSVKRLVNFTMENKSLKEGDQFEIDLYSKCFATEDKVEGMRAFLEKRKPVFKGK